jgi:capsular polysaccharide biosynthesis protein
VGPSGLRIVDAPNVTIVSSKKKETMNLAIALLIGLLLGGGLVVVKTALDPTVRYADEVPALLDLPVLAVVPYSRALARQNKKTPRATERAIHRGRLADLRRSS